MPTYAPAILSVGSVEYQLGHAAKGRKLFEALLGLPKSTEDFAEIIDKAGDFLIQSGRYRDGLEFFRRAPRRFPREVALYQGVSRCACHLGLHNEAVTQVDSWPRLVWLVWAAFDVDRKPLDHQNFLTRPDSFSIPYEAERVHGITTEHAAANRREEPGP